MTVRTGWCLAAWAGIAVAGLTGCNKFAPVAQTAAPQGAPVAAAVNVPETFDGSLDLADVTHVTGWAWDSARPDQALKVDVYDGTMLLATVPATEFRQDLLENKIGTGKYKFLYNPPETLADGKTHLIHVKYAGSDKELKGSPRTLGSKKS
jgi:hypothetical protein